METLKDHVILYDNECPMCDLYTNAFVKTHMLDKDGRVAFTDANEIISFNGVDRSKACDEIALVNVKTGGVLYGVDSLMKILENRFPFFKHLFKLRLFRAIVRKFYAFISFNRKVIIPGKDITNINACRPNFNLRYRVLYIVLTWLLTSFVLAKFAAALVPLIPPTNFYREFAICGGQIVFQAMVIAIVDRKKTWEYLGNMMTISFAGALLLLIALAFETFLVPIASAGIFAAVVSLMFVEHIRRVKLLKLPRVMTASWVTYRILILMFLL